MNKIQYDLRPCPHCGYDIPNITKKGRRLPKSKYNKRKTCGTSECWGSSWQDTYWATRNPIEPVVKPNAAMQLFLTGAIA